jgi:Skp family chaperone for outer membrane proteins
MSVNKDVAVLYEELGRSNEILDRIEGIVGKFQTKLGKIADDVSKLQDKSKKYTIALNNRRELEKELHEFLDGILLTPQLVRDLIQNEVDLKYIERLEEFSKVLQNVNSVVSSSKDSSHSKAISDVISEIERLTIQVCHKIRNFMVNRFYTLHKDKTNFQIVQQNSLIRFKALNQFIRDHSQEKYVELTNSYSDYMSKRYYHDLRDY